MDINILDKLSFNEKTSIATSFLKELNDSNLYEFINWNGKGIKEGNYWVRECFLRNCKTQNIVSRGIILKIVDKDTLYTMLTKNKN